MVIQDTHARGRCLRVGRAEKVLTVSDRNLQCTKQLMVFVVCFLLFLISGKECISELPLHAAHHKQMMVSFAVGMKGSVYPQFLSSKTGRC